MQHETYTSPRATSRRPLKFFVLIIAIAALFTAEPAGAQPAVTDGSSSPAGPGFTVARLVIRVPELEEIGIAGDEWRIALIEEMRAQGLRTLGAESLVFGTDHSEDARFAVGGTVNELSCAERSDGQRCRIGIQWEVMDTFGEKVIYRVLTRTDQSGRRTKRVAKRLVLSAFRNFLRRPKFRQLVQQPPGDSGSVGYRVASVQRCAVAAGKMPAESQLAMSRSLIVRSGNGGGAGVIISPDGWILTAAHVVKPDVAIQVELRSGQRMEAKLVRVNQKLDVALLHASLPSKACAGVNPTPPDVGQDVYVIGSPASSQLAFSVSRGILSGTRELDGVPLLQTDASVNPGNSGGPLLDNRGLLLGIVSRKLSGEAIEGLGFAIPIGPALTGLGLNLDEKTDPSLYATRAVLPSAPPVLEDTPDPMPWDRTEQPLAYAASTSKASTRGVPAESSNNGRQALRLVSAGVGIVSSVVVASTWFAFDADNRGGLSRSRYESLRNANDLAWLGVGLSAATFGLSYVGESSKQTLARRPNPKPSVRVAVGYPAVLMLGGEY